jgi:curved DNA-binding protein CbpA
MTNQNANDDDYYAVLGIPWNSDSKAIRKAYLKLSLQYHPDKNVHHLPPDEAQAAFVRIGQAYQVLSDPTQRALYDRSYRQNQKSKHSDPYRRTSSQQQQQQPQYRPNTTSSSNSQQPPHAQYNDTFASGFGSSTSASSSNPNNSYHSSPSEQQQYETYREAFDATMAGLNDDELREVTGAAALFSSIVGGIIGARMFQNSHPAIRSIGSAMGSAIASQATTSIIHNTHEQAKQRAVIDSDRRREHIVRQQYHGSGTPTTNSKFSSSPPSNQSSSKSYLNTNSTSSSQEHSPNQQQQMWKDVVENVMSGPIAKEVGKVIQQVANDLLHHGGKNSTTAAK